MPSEGCQGAVGPGGAAVAGRGVRPARSACHPCRSLRSRMEVSAPHLSPPELFGRRDPINIGYKLKTSDAWPESRSTPQARARLWTGAGKGLNFRAPCCGEALWRVRENVTIHTKIQCSECLHPAVATGVDRWGRGVDKGGYEVGAKPIRWGLVVRRAGSPDESCCRNRRFPAVGASAVAHGLSAREAHAVSGTGAT